ncbi:MAG: hypothetical protein HOU81_18995 [Hamadaea sp.]|uniref:hypothetical protein n=1 Tax=Hamadaea sp. TaxID=2024425 RepID=UPI001859E75E|nr:hypothetical protein [Hamadaea sp.]NUR72907.1 hypothetical protein [Hamadaea sp.]NUT18189.1 hypothetical protein [Hamadaea sp.]
MIAPAGSPWRFNAPPGWPVPPSGWTPPPGWKPDPSWPSAPAGWTFWIPAQRAPQSTAQRAQRAASRITPSPVTYTPSTYASPKRSGISTAVKILAGFISLVAALASIWFGYQALPEKYTAEQWRQKALATCERDFADVRFSVNGVLLKVAAAMTTLPPPGQVDQGMTEAGNALGDLAKALRRFSADLREIKVPDDLPRDDLTAYLTVTGQLTGGIEQMADLLVQYQIGRATPEMIQQTMTTMDTMSQTTIPEWGKAAQRLGLDTCVPTS